jgi:hypothetical protein
MSRISDELKKNVSLCLGHDSYGKGVYQRLHESDGIWRRTLSDRLAINTRIIAVDAITSIDHILVREAKTRARVNNSTYPLFTLREYLPVDVAWIIVILAHWSD